MNSNHDHSPLDGNDRLDDALLREHARAGIGADEAFLAQLESALNAETQCLPQNNPGAKPKPSRRNFQTMGLAATLLIAAGISLWAVREKRNHDILAKHVVMGPQAEQVNKGKVPLQTNFPPELIEGTPKPIVLPQTTPNADKPVASLVSEPRVPASSQARVIAANTANTTVIPIPEINTPPSIDFGDSSFFGQGWGSSNEESGGFAREKRTADSMLMGRQSVGVTGSVNAPPVDRERYGQLIDNPWKTPIDEALSTFSIDVDTASYTNLRRIVQDGSRIPEDSVRLEEMVNYFDYSYTPPTGEHPFAVHVGNASCPWNPDHQLVRVALKGREIERTERVPANLVFLLDVSGSMNEPRKLPLVKQAFQLLMEELNDSDTLSIVVYAGAEGLALPPTRCDAAGRERVSTALNKLNAGGSTNGGAGIKLAYQIAMKNFKPGGINRVILATDGDFNVGVTEDGGLVSMVEKKAKSNVFLTVLGFGTGNLNDGMLEAITNKGNGTYHYIDTLQEARHVFLQKLMGTLVTIAKDVKIQIEFNPAQVKRYRLLGYANRMLRKEDFSNDQIDAGDIGSGHTVTAFYEVETGDGRQTPPSETLRYQENKLEKPAVTNSNEWLTVKLRYKQPEGERSTLIEQPFIGMPRAFNETDADFRFATSVAMTGLLLRHTEGLQVTNFGDVRRIAEQSLGTDPHGQRAEFLGLVKTLASRNGSNSNR